MQKLLSKLGGRFRGISFFPLFLLFVAPAFFSLVLGFEMGSDRIETIPTVIVDHDQTEFSRTLTDYVANSDFYEVVQYPSTDQAAQDLLTSGQALVAVIVPQGLTAQVSAGQPCSVQIFYDGSMMPVISSAKTTMSEIFLTVRAGYLQGIYEGKLDTVASQASEKILPLQLEMKTLFNPNRSYRYFLLPGMLVAILQVSFGVIGCQMAWTKRKSWLSNALVLLGWSGLGTLAVLLCLGLQYQFFALPYRGDLMAGLGITFVFTAATTWFGYLMGKIIPLKLLAVQITSVFILPTSILSGYTFPLLAMPAAFQPIGEWIPFCQYGDAIRNLCLKEISWPSIASPLIHLLIFWLVELLLFALISLGEKIHETKLAKFKSI